jgi:hypothetical protein
MRLLAADGSWRREVPAGETTMNWNLTKTLGAGRAVAVVGLTGVLLMSSGRMGLAQSGESASRTGLEGTWLVEVTLRDCSTNAQIGLPFESVVTFHRGGTVTETTSSRAFAIGQRSDGQGKWQFQGHDSYSQRMVSLIKFDTASNLPLSPGFSAGWSIVSTTLELTDPDHAMSSGTNEFYRADGTQYRTGCSTAVAVRFE